MVEAHSKGFHLTWLVFYSAQSIAIVTLNIITVTTILVNPQLRSRRSLICVMNLAIADAFVGLFAMPCYITEYGIWFHIWSLSPVKYNKLVIRGAEVFSSIASLSFLVLICLERCYATFYPFKSRVTSLVTYIVGVVSTWLLAVVAAVLYLATTPFFFLMAWLLGSTCIISIGYLAIYFKMKRQSRQRQEMGGGQNTTREKELAKTLFIVTVSSIVCWVPFTVLSLLVYYRVYYTILATNFGKLLQFTNSLINPILYQLRMKDVRKATVMLLKKCSRDSPRAPEHRSIEGFYNAGMNHTELMTPSPSPRVRREMFQERPGLDSLTPSPSPRVRRKIFHEGPPLDSLVPSPSPSDDRKEEFQERKGSNIVSPSPSPGVDRRQPFVVGTGKELLLSPRINRKEAFLEEMPLSPSLSPTIKRRNTLQ